MCKPQNGFAILNIVQKWCLNLSSSDKNQEKKKKKKNGKFFLFLVFKCMTFTKKSSCVYFRLS